MEDFRSTVSDTECLSSQYFLVVSSESIHIFYDNSTATDGKLGYAEAAPYDAIHVGAAAAGNAISVYFYYFQCEYSIIFLSELHDDFRTSGCSYTAVKAWRSDGHTSG
jgi:hypothetical protein